eukprot:811205_1
MAQSTEIRISNDDRSNWNIISKHITIVQLDSPEHKVTLVICQKSDQEGIFKLITKQRPPYAFQPKALIIRHHHYHARDFHQKYHFIIFSQKNFASKFKKFQLKTEDISRDVLNFRPSTMKPIQMEFDQKYNLKAIDIVLHHRTISECLIVVYNLQRVISAMTLIAAIPSVAAMSVKLSRKSKHEVSFEEIFSIIVQETDHHLISTMDCMQILQLDINMFEDRGKRFEDLKSSALRCVIDRIPFMNSSELHLVRQSVKSFDLYNGNVSLFLSMICTGKLKLLKCSSVMRDVLPQILQRDVFKSTEHVYLKTFVIEQTLCNRNISKTSYYLKTIIDLLYKNIRQLLLTAHRIQIISFTLQNLFINDAKSINLNYVITEENIRNQLNQLIFLMFHWKQTEIAALDVCHCMLQCGGLVNFKNVSIEPLTSFASTVTSLIDSMATPFNVSVPMYLTAMIRAFTFGGASRAKEKSLLTILSDLAASRVENIQRIDYLRKVCTSNNDKSFLWGM